MDSRVVAPGRRTAWVLLALSGGLLISWLVGNVRWDSLNLWIRDRFGVNGLTADRWVIAARKSLHVVIFAAATLVAARAMPRSRTRWLRAALLMFGVAVADESVQSLLPDRKGRITDVLFDAAGVAAACAWLARRDRRASARDEGPRQSASQIDRR